MGKLFVTFLEDRWMPRTGDYETYELMFSAVAPGLVGKPEEKAETLQGRIHLKIVGTVFAQWSVSNAALRWTSEGEELRKVCFEYCVRYIEEIVRSGVSGDALREALRSMSKELNSGNTCAKCAYDPESIDRRFNEGIMLPRV